MDRRDFLKSLAAFGAQIALPPGIAIPDAPEAAIAAAWQTATANPFVYYVSTYGTISAEGDEEYWPSSRAELYRIEEPADIKELLRLGKEYGRIQDFIDGALDSAGVSSFRRLTEEDQFETLRQVQLWIDSRPNEDDAEYVVLTGANGQGEALRYFRDYFEFCDELNIVIVEGDCPGSSYFAAELRDTVENANANAEALDIPIRFAWES